MHPTDLVAEFMIHVPLPFFSWKMVLCLLLLECFWSFLSFQAQVQIARDNAVTSQQRSASGRRMRKEACPDRTGSNPFTEQDSGILDVDDEEADGVREELFKYCFKRIFIHTILLIPNHLLLFLFPFLLTALLKNPRGLAVGLLAQSRHPSLS